MCLGLAGAAREARADDYGGSGNGASTLYLGAGLLSQDAGRLTQSTAGTTTLTTALYTELALLAEFSFSSDWGFSPAITYTPLGHKSPDGGEKATLLAFCARATYALGSADFHFGPGLLYYRISGSGGTIDLNNGSSTSTTTFGLPSGVVTSRSFFLNPGFGVDLSPIRLDADAWITDALTTRRAVDLVLTVSYGLF